MFAAAKGSVSLWGAGLLALALVGGGALYAKPEPVQIEDLPIYAVGTLTGAVAPTSTLSRLRRIYVYGEDKQKLVAILRADADGRFGTTLNPGTYYLDVRYPPRGPSRGAASAKVEAGKLAQVSLKIAK